MIRKFGELPMNMRKGYKVLADLPNHERPNTVKAVRPDLSVKKKRHETLIEIEALESVGNKRDEKQKKVSNGTDPRTSFYRNS